MGRDATRGQANGVHITHYSHKFPFIVRLVISLMEVAFSWPPPQSLPTAQKNIERGESVSNASHTGVLSHYCLSEPT